MMNCLFMKFTYTWMFVIASILLYKYIVSRGITGNIPLDIGDLASLQNL
jgi:hypothetical protein